MSTARRKGADMNRLKRWFFPGQKLAINDIVTLTLSVLTGIMIWVYVDSRRTEERIMTARLEVAVPAGWRTTGQMRNTVRVLLRGPRTIMGALTSDEVRFYRSLEIPAGAANSQEIHIELTREDLRGLPRDIAVLDIPDPSVKINLIRPVRKYIPVEVQFQNETSKEYERTGYDFSPEFVAVYAAEDEFSPTDVVKTVPINLKDHTASFGSYVDLEPLKLKSTTVFPDESIFVQVNISQRKAQITLEKIPVSILLATPLENLPGSKLIPAQVSVTLEGGAQAIKSLTPGAVSVYIDTKDMGSSVQGEYVMRCRTRVPDGLKVVTVVPQEVRWVFPQAPKAAQPAAQAGKAAAAGVGQVPVRKAKDAASVK